MSATLRAIARNPVRLYAVATAGVALLAYYVPSLPQALVLGLVAAIFGGGEAVRATVTPNESVVVSTADLPASGGVVVVESDGPERNVEIPFSDRQV